MEDDKRPPLEEDICIHIFTVSSGMVGVCLTAVGLLHVVTSIRKVATFADDIVTVDAVLFLVSALSAYWALRTRRRQRIYALERHVHCRHGAVRGGDYFHHLLAEPGVGLMLSSPPYRRWGGALH
jgi:hypothetical protein